MPRFCRALCGPLRDDQAPGDQRRHVAGPAVLDGQARKVHICTLPHQFLAWRAAALLGRHVPQRFEQTAHAHHLLEALGRFGFLERRQQLAKRPQPGDALHPHGTRHALGRAEQVAQHRHAVARGVLEQHGRAARAQHAVAQGRHLQVGRYRLAHTAQLAALFKLLDEVAQVVVVHLDKKWLLRLWIMRKQL
jgi:hypothetical protein